MILETWHKNLNLMVDELNDLNEVYRSSFSGKRLDGINPEKFFAYRKNHLRVQARFNALMQQIQNQMELAGVVQLPPEIQEISKLLLQQGLRNKKCQTEIERLRQTIH